MRRKGSWGLTHNRVRVQEEVVTSDNRKPGGESHFHPSILDIGWTIVAHFNLQATSLFTKYPCTSFERVTWNLERQYMSIVLVWYTIISPILISREEKNFNCSKNCVHTPPVDYFVNF